MSERRSARSRQSIDYSKFGRSEADFDDDDFVDSTPPVGKKPKHSNDTKGQKSKVKKDEKSKSGKTHSEEAGKSRKRADRVSLDDKLYERDLQAALELSQLEYKGDVQPADLEDKDGEESETQKTTQGNNEKLTDSKQSSDATPTTGEAAVEVKTKSTLEDLDKIEVLEVGIDAESPSSKKRKRPSKQTQDADWAVKSDSDGGRRKRRAATQAVKKFADDDSEEDGESVDDDFKVEQDTKPESDDSSNEDSDDGADSDFEVGGNKQRGGKTQPRSRVAITSSRPTPKPRLTATVPVVNKGRGKSTSKLAPSSTSTVLPPVRSPALGVGKPSPGGSLQIRKPSWMGTALGGVNVKSPSGGLRLGLSRKARVKSLHPSVHA